MEDEIVTFFAALDRQVQNLEYGTLSGTVLVAKGRPVTHTLNLVLSKRKRYKTGKDGVDKGETP